MKPIIVITMGDYNGIGPEVTLRAVLSSPVRRICRLLLIGSLDVFEFYARRLRMRIHLRETTEISRKRDDTIPIFHLRKFQRPIIRPGTISREAGGYAGDAIEVAAKLCLQGVVDGMVTAPVSKEAMDKAGFHFPGQTEMLAELTSTSSVVMMLVARNFRVGLATVHTPFRSVPHMLTRKRVTEKVRIVHRSLRQDFGVRTPTIAVLGLNPHAGENGLLGDEEKKFIFPAIQSVRRNGMNVDGPFPADGFFGMRAHTEYDAVFAMYHDQGLIPLKMEGFDIGVNYSAGLPIVRTSPDHGTAFEIAGKGIADPSSMIEAIKLAITIINNRKKSSR